MFERFTDRAHRVIVLAQEEARRLGHREIDVGHLVLGALTVADATRRVDDHGGVAGVRRLVESSLGAATVERRRGSTAPIPLTPAARATLELGRRLALRSGRDYVVANDILLAALGQPSVTALLAAAGIDLEALHAAARDALPEPTVQAADPESLLPPSDSQVIIELLRQVLRLLEVVIERLDRDHGAEGGLSG